MAQGPLTIAALEAALRAAKHAPSDPWLGEQAAVALLLRETVADVEALLIRRAEKDGDPWSGHMALPGGRRDPSDPDIEATARREALEEVGIDVALCARRLGRLPDQLTKAHGRIAPLTIAPIVYALERNLPAISCSSEVAATTWVPLGALRSGRHDGVHVWRIAGVPLRMPCWTWEGAPIWGITHRILGTLFALL